MLRGGKATRLDSAMKPIGPNFVSGSMDVGATPHQDFSTEKTFWNLPTQIAIVGFLLATVVVLASHCYLASQQAVRPSRLVRVVDQDVLEYEPGAPEVALSQAAYSKVNRLAPIAPAGSQVTRKITDRDPPIDLNTATIQQLQTIPGVGPTMAGRIDSRRNRQPFHTVDELRQVSGIGVKTLEKIRPFVTVSVLATNHSEN